MHLIILELPCDTTSIELFLDGQDHWPPRLIVECRLLTLVSVAASNPMARGLGLILSILLLPNLLWAARIQPGDILVDDFGTGRLQVYSLSGSGMSISSDLRNIS